MAKPKTQTSTLHREPIKKRTSIGHGKRKRSSFKRSKAYRGQGH